MAAFIFDGALNGAKQDPKAKVSVVIPLSPKSRKAARSKKHK